MGLEVVFFSGFFFFGSSFFFKVFCFRSCICLGFGIRWFGGFRGLEFFVIMGRRLYAF